MSFSKTKKNSDKKNKREGFTLIEALVFLFIFSLVTISFYSLITVGTRHILISKNRLGAIALANEKMEIIRNLNYDDIGTVDGVVNGDLLQEEDVNENGKDYIVNTTVLYVDDPYDGTLGGSPNDTAYKDYKVVKIAVSWNNGGADQGQVDVVSRFVSPGLEVSSPGEGILSINVFSDQAGGDPVSQSSVNIVNPDTGVSETISTDDDGNVMLVGVGESIKNYQLTVSKSGYETVTTFPAYPDTTYNPVDVHASVIEGLLNVANIVQNKDSDIKIKTVDYLGNSVPDIDFNLTGGRILGTEVAAPYDEVYNLDVSEKTNSSGEKTYTDVSPGQYFFELSSSEDKYDMVGISPASPFTLSSDVNQEVEVKVADKNETGLLIYVTRSSDGEEIEGAEVSLENSDISYSEKVTTKADGMAFFPTEENPVLEAGTYNISVKADGFEDNTGEVTIDSGELSKENLTMVEN